MASKNILDRVIWSNTNPYVVPQNQNTSGQDFAQRLLQNRSNTTLFDIAQKNKTQSEVAQDIAGKSASNISLNEYGLVGNTGAPKPEDRTTDFNKSLSSISNSGNLATQAAEARNTWQKLKSQQDLLASFNPGTAAYNTSGMAPGTSSDGSLGGRAVALALQAYRNGTPYVWGGNSLTKGIDCSGLVQQVYSQLGIKLPRTTYEQAKAGHIINLKSLQPGDLVFYNTGSSDPNGIGRYSHVAIYIGNGQIVDARSTKSGMKMGSMYAVGTPALGVRPW